MILYNIRYRGSFEYDKFALNTLQIRNEVLRMLKEFNNTEGKDFLDMKQSFNNLYEEMVKEDSYVSQLLRLQLKAGVL